MINIKKDSKKIEYNRRQFIKVGSLATSFLTIPFSSSFGWLAKDKESKIKSIFPFYKYIKQYDFWEVTPMDQGGRQIQLIVVGSEKDEDIVNAVRSPGFFNRWGNPIVWDSLERTEVEKSVWLNRWYFLPSFCTMYYKTKDRSYLTEMITIMRKWRDENPLPTDLKTYFTLRPRQYNWLDMQVAWRVQNLCWCYFLGEDGFSDQEKSEMYDLIEIHSKVLLEFFGDQKLITNNHQSHGATTMLFAALLFPQLPNADSLKTKAIEILNHHLEHAFYDDGNSVELCPGYYPFFVSIFRDAYLLCLLNGVKPPVRSKSRLEQFYKYLLAVKQPDGTTPPINDSTEVTTLPTIEILQDVLKLPSYEKQESHWFSLSHQAVIRDTKTSRPAYVFLDAGRDILGHWHSGKLGFHLWYWDKAFLVDSGISNYDDPLRRNWYWKPEAHNTVLINGKGDYDKADRSVMKKGFASVYLQQWESNADYDWAVMVHKGFGTDSNPIVWIRHFILLKGIASVVVDHFESTNEHEYTWLFHLLPCSPKVNKKEQSVFTDFKNKNLWIKPALVNTGLQINTGKINKNAINIDAPVLNYTLSGKSITQSFLFLPVEEGMPQSVEFKQILADNKTAIKIKGKTASADLVILDTKGENNKRFSLQVKSK